MKYTQNLNGLIQMCTNPGHQDTVATKFCRVALNICVLKKKLAAFTPLAPGIRTLFVPVQQFVILVAICNILVAHIAGGTQAEGVEENIWA
jgi:hypothetical protein